MGQVLACVVAVLALAGALWLFAALGDDAPAAQAERGVQPTATVSPLESSANNALVTTPS